MIDAGYGKQFADLLKADFRLSSRDHSADSLTAFNAPALAQYLIGYSQALKQLVDQIIPAYAA
jgi:hypothetical protein